MAKTTRLRWGSRLLLVAILVAMALLLQAAGAMAAPVSGDQLSASPAATGNAVMARVIVQVAPSSTDAYYGVKDLVARLGGQVTQELTIINGLAATVPADAVATIAAYPGVKWVSPDGQMVSSVTEAQFTTWATAVGTSMPDRFVESALAVDSALGPNGTFATAGKATCAFTGFASEVTPGNAITKLEVALHAYIPARLGAGQDPKISIVLAGKAYEITYNHHGFETSIGQSAAKTLYVDLTSKRKWTWADLAGPIEVRIDQGKFFWLTRIYYDAVGLRVTSAPGNDPSGYGPSQIDEIPQELVTDQQANVFNDVIGATAVWNEPSKVRGNDVTVAVVDSGVIKTKDLGSRNKLNVNFNSGFHAASDLYGHGTFVAGIIAGNGKVSHGRYMGVAPEADLLNVRVSDDQGSCSEADVIAGLQWVLEHKDKYSIRVVNLSLNAAVEQSYQTSPLCAACEVLWFNGITVVASAGNKGTATLYPPANDPFVITVGATDDKGTPDAADDTLAVFSAYGVSEPGLTKPEIVTPGTKIVGLLPDNDKLTMSLNRSQSRIDKTYFTMSGTSVSAPMVSGAIALLLQDEPNLTPDQVKYRLMATANTNWLGYDPATCGAGYLDIYAAVHGETTESANTGLPVSNLLTTGENPVNSSVMWNSVMWNSVMWNSVMWNSVMWNSVMWNSAQLSRVMWNSDYWGD